MKYTAGNVGEFRRKSRISNNVYDYSRKVRLDSNEICIKHNQFRLITE